jgi:PAP2 superfamily
MGLGGACVSSVPPPRRCRVDDRPIDAMPTSTKSHGPRRARLADVLRPHRVDVEAVLLLALYLVYEATRGLTVGDRSTALGHAREIIELERGLHAFHEPSVQELVGDLHLLAPLGVFYLFAHLSATVGVLAWLYWRRPAAFAFTRTALILASLLSLVGYALFPTAPPRMVGLVDSVSQLNHVDLDHGFISGLYNPVAAVPSMHFGYALLLGGVLVREACSARARVAAALYPPLVLLVIVATGNHFLFDAAAGAAVIAVATAASARLQATAPLRLAPAERTAVSPTPALAPAVSSGDQSRRGAVGWQSG